jgi:Spy/CpxP family protein refolding chaperone
MLLLGALAIAVPATQVAANPGFGGDPLMGGAGNPERMLEHMADHLDLTDDQRDAVSNILQAAKPEIEALRDQVKANRDAVKALNPNDAADMAEVNNIAISNGELATNGTLLAVRIRGEVHAVLTDEQIEKLERSMDRFKRRNKERRSDR